MGFYGLLWASMGFYWLLWDSMGFYGLLWTSMGFYGLLWDSMGFHGLLWTSMNFVGLCWTSMVIYEHLNIFRCFGFLCMAMNINLQPWTNIIGHHLTYSDIYGNL